MYIVEKYKIMTGYGLGLELFVYFIVLTLMVAGRVFCL